MSNLVKGLPQSIRTVPTELVGRWRLISPSTPQTLYIRFGTSGEYMVSGGDLSFEVSPDGLSLDWAGATWYRYLGTGQNILGVWRTGMDATLEEMYFRDDQRTWYTDIATVLVGLYSIVTGDHSTGTMVYEERRGTVSVLGNQITVYTVFGGKYEMTFALSNADSTLTIESAPGNIFVYERA